MTVPNSKEVKFTGVIMAAMGVQILGAVVVALIAGLAFFFFLNRLGAHAIVLSIIVLLSGWFVGLLFVLPRLVRFRCPACGNKSLRYSVFGWLEFKCSQCGTEKQTWFH